LILSERLAAEVCAPVAHRQFVFTVPKRLRVFFRFDRALLGDMARLAWKTVLEVYRATLGRDDLLPGALAGIQTFGELIHWHPHIHALVSDGAFAPDGTFHPLPAVAVEPFRKLFAQKVLGLLLERGKIGPDVVENIRSWKHSGFSADKSVRIEAGDRAGLERLLRYIVRCPFSIERIIRLSDNDHVIYRAEHDDPRRFPLPQSGAPLLSRRCAAAPRATSRSSSRWRSSPRSPSTFQKPASTSRPAPHPLLRLVFQQEPRPARPWRGHSCLRRCPRFRRLRRRDGGRTFPRRRAPPLGRAHQARL
jgi:hypothetical protein